MLYKTALITGASSGIGKEIALTLADSGLQLVLLARRRDRLRRLQEELDGRVPSCQLCCDLTDLDALKKALAALQLSDLGEAHYRPIVEG